MVHKGLGRAAGGFHNADLFLHNGLEKALDGSVGLGVGQEGEVYAEGLVGEAFQQLDVLLKGLRGVVGGHVVVPRPPACGDGGGQLGFREPLHGALDDGVFNAKKFSNACFHNPFLFVQKFFIII